MHAARSYSWMSPPRDVPANVGGAIERLGNCRHVPRILANLELSSCSRSNRAPTLAGTNEQSKTVLAGQGPLRIKDQHPKGLFSEALATGSVDAVHDI